MRHIYMLILSTVLVGTMPAFAFALAHAASEVQQGAALNQALQSGAKKCVDLKDADFELLGEFFMDRMAGESHESMNSMMKQGMGDSGEEQMHAVMGKRMSGCDASAQMPTGVMSGMMNMAGSGGMMGGGTGSRGMMSTPAFGGMMNGGWYAAGFAALWYVVGILGAITLALIIVKYLRELFK